MTALVRFGFVAALLAGCASTSPSSSLAPCKDALGPAIAPPGPDLSRVSAAWHDDALGEKAAWAQARRSIPPMLGPHCGGGTSGILPELDDVGSQWAQEDTLVGATLRGDRAQEPVVCVFFPFPSVVPRNTMRNPKRLASGVLEGELKEDHKLQKNGAMFLLEAGVVVVARGSAVGRVRAMVTKSASPPAPLPIADDVDQWTYTATLRPELHWLLSNGVRLELHPHRTEREAQDDVEELERRLFGGRRAWRNGNDVYVFNPK